MTLGRAIELYLETIELERTGIPPMDAQLRIECRKTRPIGFIGALDLSMTCAQVWKVLAREYMAGKGKV